MNLSRQTFATAGCLALFLLLGGARVAEAGIEVFPNPVAVAVGEESEVEVKCTGCDYPPTGFGVLVISIDDVNIASGFPQDGEEFIINSQPPTPIRSIFRNITGVSEGTTILRVKLFREDETIPMLEEAVGTKVRNRYSVGSGGDKEEVVTCFYTRVVQCSCGDEIELHHSWLIARKKNHWAVYLCPNCHSVFKGSDKDRVRCPDCRQSFDWEAGTVKNNIVSCSSCKESTALLKLDSVRSKPLHRMIAVELINENARAYRKPS
ncbi:MAG: hypothetical protein IID38_10300, partial [Planctomycetes bacterium]|nr:hypothetical protein [Planctomycetota bacterium]